MRTLSNSNKLTTEIIRWQQHVNHTSAETTGQQKKHFFQYPFQLLTNLGPEWCAEHTVWSSERRKLAALFSQSQAEVSEKKPQSVMACCFVPASKYYFFYVKQTKMSICVAFSYIFYSELTSNRFFLTVCGDVTSVALDSQDSLGW